MAGFICVALLDFPVVFQWIGHDLSGVGSPNRKTPDMPDVIVHGLTLHVMFQNHRSETVVLDEGQSVTVITLIELC